MYHQSMLDHAASLALYGQCVVILALFIGYTAAYAVRYNLYCPYKDDT